MLKKILIPFIFLGAFFAICATILVGYIIYENSTNPQNRQAIQEQKHPIQSASQPSLEQPDPK